ncbi:WxL domain-containing protein [Bacillus altitudinis]|uniref:WxL domain-containing protein n=1 Tax=Bacillus pumilus TaxID=1408 RepID=UPI0025A122C9|nr:WxL domain-containing protein [Bacillus pumilus]MDM5319191.1 WxL domain-containing protein [Bacillus pumilus]MDR4994167.1 WxL domain-containing protein [Bacillus altitudinis]
MKKSGFAVITAAILSGILLHSHPVFAATQSIDSHAVVNFVPNEDVTPPVDPNDPNPANPVTPIDPTNPNGPTPGTAGPLSIDYASSLHFGENKISTKNEVYYAKAQTFTGGSEGPNYVQVTDNRGTETGWSLQVKQNGQFVSTSGHELTGAKITFKQAQINTISTSPKPAQLKDSFSLIPDGTGSAEQVVSAGNGEGAGTYIYAFGTGKASESISLEVPGSTPKLAEVYKTSFTWTLTDVPANENTGRF